MQTNKSVQKIKFHDWIKMVLFSVMNLIWGPMNLVQGKKNCVMDQNGFVLCHEFNLGNKESVQEKCMMDQMFFGCL